MFCSDFDVDSVLFKLQKTRFPSHKWKSLANGLCVATLVPEIEANNLKDTVGMLQELISRWIGSTTGNQWVMLIDAVVMCDEPAVAQELAKAVGMEWPPCSGTTVAWAVPANKHVPAAHAVIYYSSLIPMQAREFTWY